jgi:hypothetical protein
MWSSFERYWRLPPERKKLLCEALAALALARLAMAFLPFRRIAAWLGTPGTESAQRLTKEQTLTAEAVGWAVGAVGHRVPWDGRCLAQALAASGMLRRRGMEGTVSFGVRRGESAGFDAHAWLRIGSCIVTGGPAHEQFKAFTTFARKQA